MAVHRVRQATGATAGRAVPYPAFDEFYEQVAARQIADWLPAHPQRVVDVSRHGCAAAAVAGHHVVPVLGSQPDWTPGRDPHHGTLPLSELPCDWRRAGADAVIAEGLTLSYCLAAEVALDELAAVLRPGGRLLCCVESLVLGLGRLAEQGRWAELADAPNADVVLVPDGTGQHITRAFWPEELAALLGDAGFDVEWIRPRTVLSPEAVQRALTGGSTIATLVQTEVALATERAGESIGMHLLAAAVRR